MNLGICRLHRRMLLAVGRSTEQATSATGMSAAMAAAAAAAARHADRPQQQFTKLPRNEPRPQNPKNKNCPTCEVWDVVPLRFPIDGTTHIDVRKMHVLTCIIRQADRHYSQKRPS